MTTQDGIFVLMGSGETTPTMVTLHQQIVRRTIERRGVSRLKAALLDTPYGFQENADEITDKAQHYFSHNVGQQVERIAAGALAGAAAIEREGVLDQIRQRDWLFAGPGSPTYAQRQWASGPFGDAFADVVARGGTLLLASAAAVSAGERTIPVYEIYKAGAPVHWEDGMGLARRILGWNCVVIPHYDNAEGGTHDTRFCYLGERRLHQMEQELPDQMWVFGIDEHTAAVADLAAGTLSVHGRGGVHLRKGGHHVATIPAGQTTALAEVLQMLDAGGMSAPQPAAEQAVPSDVAEQEGGTPDGGPPSSLGEQALQLSTAFDQALADGDARAATAAALDLEQAIRDWSADTLTGEDLDAAVSSLRGMITRLGGLATDGLHDHTDLVRPLIESMLHVREDARQRKAFEVADHIRDHMDADGINVRDTREGTEWDWDEPEITS